MKVIDWIAARPQPSAAIRPSRAARLQPLPASGERSDRRGEAELRQGDPGEGEFQQANRACFQAFRQPRCGTAESIAAAPRRLKLPHPKFAGANFDLSPQAGRRVRRAISSLRSAFGQASEQGTQQRKPQSRQQLKACDRIGSSKSLN